MRSHLAISHCIIVTNILFDSMQEQAEVAENLNPDLQKYTDRGHFMTFSFPDLLKNIKKYL